MQTPEGPMLNPAPCADEDGLEAPPRVLAAVTAVVERLVSRNNDLAHGLSAAAADDPLEAFAAARAPSISVGRYLERMYRYTDCSPSCFVVAFAYVDRLAHRHPGALVVSLNVHRLLLACVLVASKVLDDVHHDNAFYARVGGVSNDELNRLEMELLFRLDFRVMVTSSDFEGYCTHLEKKFAWITMVIDRPIWNSVDNNGEVDKRRRTSLTFII